MKECMECGKEFEETKRKSEWWKTQYSNMGCCADLCNKCWFLKYRINVENK